MSNHSGFVLINLLPYREKLKKEKIKQFGLLMAMFAVMSLGVVFAGHTYLSLNIENQLVRNKYLEKENEDLNKQIKSIAGLKQEIKETLAKRQVVESLQVNRADGVNIFNEIANNLPEGTSLKSVKRVDDKITIIGQTQSNTKVSGYMSALDATNIFEKPELVEIKAVSYKPVNMKKNTQAEEFKINEFTIVVAMEKQKEEAEQEGKNKKLRGINEKN